MTDYLILKDFPGSQDGIHTECFTAGTTRTLSDSLVAALGGPDSGYVKEAGKAAQEIAEAPAELAEAVRDAMAGAEIRPRELAEGELLQEGELPKDATVRAETRDTKVTGPTETKPAKAKSKK